MQCSSIHKTCCFQQVLGSSYFFLRYQCYALDVVRGNEIDSHSSCLCAKLRPGTYPRFCLSALLAPGTYLRFLGSQKTYPLFLPIGRSWEHVDKLDFHPTMLKLCNIRSKPIVDIILFIVK